MWSSAATEEIYIGTGGGRTFAESILLEHFQCPEIDVINLHDYEELTWTGMHDNLKKARDLGQTWGKNLGTIDIFFSPWLVDPENNTVTDDKL